MAQAYKKITEGRFIWYGHVTRRDEEHILRKVLRKDIPGSGRGDGQGDVEKKDQQSYSQKYMMGKGTEEKKKTKMTHRDPDLSDLDAAWFRDPANDARRR